MRALLIASILAAAFAVVSVGGSSSRAAEGADAQSVAAFQTMTKVLNHPRCMNCHTTTAWPTQGDDQHRHTFNIARGTDDRGASGMRCSTCHKDKNVANIPGAPDWHLAPLAQGWTGLTPGAICRALLDPAKNGGRTKAQLIAHLETAQVVWAWTPGAKRAAPPLTHKDFMAAAKTWIAKGAKCPPA